MTRPHIQQPTRLDTPHIHLQDRGTARAWSQGSPQQTQGHAAAAAVGTISRHTAVSMQEQRPMSDTRGANTPPAAFYRGSSPPPHPKPHSHTDHPTWKSSCVPATTTSPAGSTASDTNWTAVGAVRVRKFLRGGGQQQQQQPAKGTNELLS